MAKSTCLIALFVAVVACAEAIRIDTVQPPSRRGRYIPNVKKNDPRCTNGNGLFANPKDCTRYLKCVNGDSQEKKCPEDFKFDSIKYCVAPTENPDCGSPHGPVDVDEKCPERYGIFPVKSNDCHKYLVCKDGIPTVKKCPEGHVYRDVNGYCVRGKTCPRQQSEENSVCKRANQLLPVETNCRKYIKCVNFKPHEKDCPAGTAFDPKKHSPRSPCTKEQLKKCQNNDILKVQSDE